MRFGSTNLKSTFVLTVSMQLVACGGGDGSAGGMPPGGGSVTPIDPASIAFEQHYDLSDRVAGPYPATWDRDIPNLEPEILVIFLEPAESATDQFRENVSFVKVPLGTPSTGGGVSNIQAVSTRQVNVSGFSAEETIFDAQVAGVPLNLRFMEVAVEFDGFIYALLYIGERATFDRNIEIARDMATNVNIGQVIFSNMASGSDLSTPGKPAIANDGTDFFVVSCREDTSFPFDTDLVAQFVPQDREIVAAELLLHADVDTGNTGCTFTRPTISFDGANYLVTYMTLLNGNRRIAGRRVSTTGQILDATPIDISQNDLGSAFEPITAFDGSRHMVVWQEDHLDPVTQIQSQQIRGAFVTAGGISSATFLVAADLPATQSFIYRPQLAIGDNQAMVIWEPRFESDTRRPARPLFGQLLDLSGSTILPDPLLIRSDSGGNPRFSQVVSDGQRYVVGWIEGLLETSTIRAGEFGLYARGVSQTGALLNGTADDSGVEIVAENSELPMEYLDLSFNNNEFLFLWAAAAFGTDFGVYANRVSADLSVISAVEPVAGTDSAAPFGSTRPEHPSVSYTPTQTLIAWPTENGFVEGWYQ